MKLYGLEWSDASPVQVEMEFIRKGGYMEVQGKRYGNGLPFHYEAMRKLLWPRLDDHRWHKLCRDEILSNKVTVLLGPGSCVAGHTRILNPITGERPTIKELCDDGKNPTVMTLFGPQTASVPFIKGRSRLVEITLEGGYSFASSPEHLVLTESGYVDASSLRIGQSLLSYDECRPLPTLGISPTVCSQDGGRYSDREQDFVSDYPVCFRSHGEQPHNPIESFQVLETLPFDAQAHKLPAAYEPLDVRGNAPKHIHPYQLTGHPSSSHIWGRDTLMGNLSSSHISSEMISHGGDSYERLLLSWLERNRNQPFETPIPCSPHSYLECGSPYRKYMVQGKVVRSIKQLENDDFYDLQVPNFNHYFAEGAIHHNSGKTHEASWIYLVEYMCFPEETCVLVSSTDIRGLRLRVWGEMTMLWQEAVEKYDFLPGHLLDSRIAITTDEMADGDYSDRRVRDMRKGIIGIPTVQSGKFIGLGKWIGIKQKRLRLIADEAAAMGSSFLSAFANLNKNEDFRAVIIGNPADPLDPLGKAAEPLDGWSAHLEPKKTEVWKTRFMNGTCVNLIGTDSPNFDFPENQPTRYKYLISREKIADTLSFFAKDSFEYYSQCVGCMKVGTLDDRIITRELCRNYNSLDPAVWKGTEKIKVCALDAAYGGDRAVCGHVEFGEDVKGHVIIEFGSPQIVPVTVNSTTSPEEQLATWVRDYCERNEIPPANFFHDSTGRGGLGTAIARAWSAECNPVEFGGSASDRPVSMDLFTYDLETQSRRLAKCNEHYDRLVSELWYQFRYAVESRQIRSLPEEVMDELCMRKWERVRNNKISVETKQKMKERIGRSPDLGDWACLCLEGARRLGFVIEKFKGIEEQGSNTTNYLETELRNYRKHSNNRQLHYSKV